MTGRYVLPPRAQADLDDIWDYSADRWGLDQAETYTVTASEGREFQQRILPLSANALAVDPQGKRLYVADYEYSGTSQSNLVKVDPATGAWLASVPLSGDPIPNRLTISADGKYAYVAVFIELENTAEIDRVDLATMTVDLKIPFSEFGVMIDDVTVSPLDSSTIAVSYGYIGKTSKRQALSPTFKS
jgi:DNA-binding beta-propeller fold protein YncE